MPWSNVRVAKAFVRASIKKPDTELSQLDSLLEQLKTDELRSYLTEIRIDRSFGAAMAVDHWKTKEQIDVLRGEIFTTHGIEMANLGDRHAISERQVLVERLRSLLIDTIQKKRRENENYNQLPFFSKLHGRIGMAIVTLVFAAFPFGLIALLIEISLGYLPSAILYIWMIGVFAFFLCLAVYFLWGLILALIVFINGFIKK